MNSIGELISNEKLTSGSHPIDITQFTNGIYFVKVIQNNTARTLKLIKE
jgi:hypothetical protein